MDYYLLGATLREYNAGSIEANKFKYQGKGRYSESDYNYFKARSYDAHYGKFKQTDIYSSSNSTTSTFIGLFENIMLIIDPTGKVSIYFKPSRAANITIINGSYFNSGTHNNTWNVNVRKV